MTDQHVLYLLHFPHNVSGARHYLGITTRKGLRTRLRKHLGGWGAGLTARAAAQCPHFVLVAIWRNADHATEKRLKQGGHLKQYCAQCSIIGPRANRQVRHINIELSIPKATQALGLTHHPLSW